MGRKPASELRVLVKRVCWGEWKTTPPPKKKNRKGNCCTAIVTQVFDQVYHPYLRHVGIWGRLKEMQRILGV